MALVRDTWLHIAQQLPINGSTRVPHRGDRTNRDNLIIYNHADRWSAYCQSCKVGGVLFKSHVKVTDMAAPKASTDLTLPPDMVPVLDLPKHLQNAVLGFLSSKGMDRVHFPGGLLFSDERKRLMVPTKWGWLGRDTTGGSMQKWLTYNRTQYLGDAFSMDVVIVEDPFSFFKVRWAINGCFELKTISVACALGIGIRDSLFIECLRANSVWLMYDGDAAGQGGAIAGARRFRSAGIRSYGCPAPRGKDPKDLSGEEIRQHLKEHYGRANTGVLGESSTL